MYLHQSVDPSRTHFLLALVPDVMVEVPEYLRFGDLAKSPSHVVLKNSHLLKISDDLFVVYNEFDIRKSTFIFQNASHSPEFSPVPKRVFLINRPTKQNTKILKIPSKSPSSCITFILEPLHHTCHPWLRHALLPGPEDSDHPRVGLLL